MQLAESGGLGLVITVPTAEQGIGSSDNRRKPCCRFRRMGFCRALSDPDCHTASGNAGHPAIFQ